MSAEENTSDSIHTPQFLNMVALFATSVMHYLGKIIDPATGKTQVNLDAAQANIDMLDMLEAKTRGNLSKDEDKFLKDTLKSLKLNFVETAEMEQKKKAAKPEPAAANKPADRDDQHKTADNTNAQKTT